MPIISNLKSLVTATAETLIPVVDVAETPDQTKKATLGTISQFILSNLGTLGIATTTTAGVIKIGTGLQGSVDGTLSVKNTQSFDQLTITGNTDTVNPNVGSLVVSSGLGVGGNFAVQGNLYLGDVTQTLSFFPYTSTNFSKIFVRPSLDINASQQVTSDDDLSFNRLLDGVYSLNNPALDGNLPFILQHYDNTTTGIIVIPTNLISAGSTATSAFNGAVILTAGDQASNKVNTYIRVGGNTAGQADVKIRANQTYVGTGTNSNSTTTGALVIEGGIGIGQDIIIGGNTYVQQGIYMQGHLVSTATNIPIASVSVLGGIKVGANLEIDPVTGILNATTATLNVQDPTLQINRAETQPYVSTGTQVAGIAIIRGPDINNVAFFGLDDSSFINTPSTSTRGIYVFAVANQITGIRSNYIRVSTSTNELNIFGLDNPSAVISVIGTTNYENQVIDDDHIPNKKFVTDYFATTATSGNLGTVKIGSGITADPDGTINVVPYTLNSATDTILGGVKIGAGINITYDGTISVNLPANTQTSNLSILNQGLLIYSTVTTLDFVGQGVSAANIGSTVTVTISSTPNLNVQNEGTTLTNTASSINFVGPGVDATVSGNNVTVTISGTSFNGGTVSGATQFTDTTESNSTLTGAVTIAGGIGVGKSISVGSNITAQTITATTTVSAQDINVVNTVTALSFQSTSAATPEIYSASNLNLAAVGRVQVSQSPFKVWSITSSTRDTIVASNGDIIYNNETHKFQGYANGAWVDLH